MSSNNQALQRHLRISAHQCKGLTEWLTLTVLTHVLGFRDILDVDLFWLKEMLHADDDLLFSCAVFDPQGIKATVDTIKGTPLASSILTSHLPILLIIQALPRVCLFTPQH